ncbi:NB-ARC domain-containing protein [Nocardiopsis sp. CC223A]|uniref:NB-ARC domain-containing protein n=1 Tax=Nocardiopsis sp. CC223A TaxID=3044051 RepID=UPI00278BEDFB|nr:NB-ARC domain-containing protein [Nocardiopsis sp. CC223A]
MPEPHRNEASDNTGTLVQVRDVHGNLTMGTLPPPPPPRRLPPADIRHTDRESELQAIQATAADVVRRRRGRVVLVGGRAGIGKSALLVEAGHLVGDRFPDGVLYSDLAAWRDDKGAVDLSAALRALLHAFHVADADDKASLTALRDRLREVTADRAVLLLIDGAHDAGELDLFTPGTGPNLLVAACAPGFRGTAELVARNAEVIALGGLAAPDGLRLLGEFPSVASRMREHGGEEGARRLVELCGGLPAALRMVAGLLDTQRDVTMGQVVAAVEEVRRRSPRLSGFDAVTEIVLDRLSPQERSLLDLLSLHGGRAVPPGLGDTAPGGGSSQVRHALVAAGILNRVGESDVGVVEAVGARVRAGIEPLSGRWRDLVDTILRFSTAVHHRADRAALGERYRLADRIESSLATLPPASYVAPFGNKREASDWQDAHLGDIPVLMGLAVQAGRERDALLLADAVWPTCHGRRRLALGEAIYASALDSARRLGEPAAVVRCAVYLARIRIELGRAEQAADLIGEAGRASADRLDEAVVLEARGVLKSRFPDAEPEDAVELLTRSRDIHRELGRPRGDALQTYQLAEQARRRGDLERAESELRSADRVARRRLEQVEASAGDRWAADDWLLIRARIDLALARVLAETGREDEARDRARGATLVYGEAAEPVRLIRAQRFLADLARRQGDIERARTITGEIRAVAEAYHLEEEAHRARWFLEGGGGRA